MLKLPRLWAVGVSSCWLLGPFNTIPVVVDIFLTFQNDQMFQAIVPFLLQVWKQLFLQGDLALCNRE